MSDRFYKSLVITISAYFVIWAFFGQAEMQMNKRMSARFFQTQNFFSMAVGDLASGKFSINLSMASGTGIVQCGTTEPCGLCDLFKLISDSINFVIFRLVPIIATLFIIFAGGMIILSGARPSFRSRGTNMLKYAIYGTIIIYSAWMITNTVLRSIAGNSNYSNNWFTIQCTPLSWERPPGSTPTPTPIPAVQKYSCNASNQCIADQSGSYLVSDCNSECGITLNFVTSSLPDAVLNSSYPQQIVVTGGASPRLFSTTDPLPPGLSLGQFGTITGTPTTVGTYTFTVKVEDSTTPTKQSATKQLIIKVVATAGGTPTPTPIVTPTPTPTPTATGGTQCLFTGINLCQGQPVKLSGGSLAPDSNPVCGANACRQFLPALQDAANKTGISVNLLKATMYKESGCQVNPGYFGSGDSWGLMQLQPGTANAFKSFCGVTETINSAWLTSPANSSKIICIAAYFYKSLADGGCGNSSRNILAGYSGGLTACQTSRDCAGETSCDGGAIRKWECLYDNAQHTACNGNNTVIGPASGYNETRNSVVNKLYCVDNPGF